jgi:acyl-CoA thioester hydrolase
MTDQAIARASAPDRLVHASVQPLRWGDMDAMGHVNNTLYYRYMEQARSEWIHVHAEGGGHDPGQGTVLLEASCRYLAPLTFPGDIEVRMYVGEPRRSSLASRYEIWSEGRSAAEGTALIVWVSLDTGRSSPIPPRLVEAIRRLA